MIPIMSVLDTQELGLQSSPSQSPAGFPAPGASHHDRCLTMSLTRGKQGIPNFLVFKKGGTKSCKASKDKVGHESKILPLLEEGPITPPFVIPKVDLVPQRQEREGASREKGY